MVALEKLIGILDKTYHSDDFVKLILSKPTLKNQPVKKVSIRKVILKEVPFFNFVLSYSDKEITKNYDFNSGKQYIKKYLESDFFNANIFTTTADFLYLSSKKNHSKLIQSKPSFTEKLTTAHNRTKKTLVNNPQLIHELGLGNKDGVVAQKSQKKFRQINKFIEIIDHILSGIDKEKKFEVIDMGSGKGYLTFALYDYLKNTLGVNTAIKGIELREQLVLDSNQRTKKLGFEGLSFLAQDIGLVAVNKLNLLIALHACDIATDLAIAKGITAEADYIIVAPCCHKQVRKSMKPLEPLNAILNHGILLERQAELLTDGLRALVLEYFGYKTKVFQFIETEHTPKNILIVGKKTQGIQVQYLEKIAALKKQFNLEYHYLEKLLKLEE